jgi:hypothetical protein
MNFAQLHLALNHAPIFAILFAAGLVLFGLLRRNQTVRKTGQWFLVLAAVTSAPVFFSGEPAEDIVETKPGVTKQLIHEHEDAGKFAFIFAVLVGAASLGLLVLEHKGKALPNSAFFALLVLALFTLSVFLRTAHLGGLIRHDELHSTAN